MKAKTRSKPLKSVAKSPKGGKQSKVAAKKDIKTLPDQFLPDQTGQLTSVRTLLPSGAKREKLPTAVVLFFYPKDNTPGCTIEAKEFSAALSKFERINVRVAGISVGTSASKANFCKKHGLKETLLADEEGKFAAKVGVYGEKLFMGRKYMGIHRTTIVATPSGEVLKFFTAVKPEGHAEEVLSFLQQQM
jgi:peroxiredoxin Q/BCP